MSLFVLNKILLNNLFFHCITFFTRNTLMASLRPGEFVCTLEGKSQPYKISIADGATVTLSDATINGTSERVCKTSSGRYTSCDWAGLTCLGNQKKEYSTLQWKWLSSSIRHSWWKHQGRNLQQLAAGCYRLLANKNALQIMTVWGLFYTIWLDRALQRALSS